MAADKSRFMMISVRRSEWTFTTARRRSLHEFGPSASAVARILAW